MRKPLLSAAMIVRDEERVLADCLASMRGIVDEIVIADTGSTDNSREIAHAFGANVFDVPWEHDFSKARNAGLDRVTGDWVLYIDADERLRDIEREALHQYLSDASKAAYRIRFHTKTGFTAYYEYRLFRNDPRIRFTRAMHEKIIPGIKRVVAEEGTAIGKCDLTIDHVGYDGDQAHKHERNLALLRAQLNEMPDDIYNLHHLGIVLEALGDEAGAVSAWSKAVAVTRSRGEASPTGQLAFGELLRWQLNQDKMDGALLVEARELYPHCWFLKWIDTRAKVKAGEYRSAVAGLDELAGVDSAGLITEQSAYDRRIFDVFAYETLGYCHFQLGDYAASTGWYEKALAQEPGREDLQARLQLAQIKAAG